MTEGRMPVMPVALVRPTADGTGWRRGLYDADEALVDNPMKHPTAIAAMLSAENRLTCLLHWEPGELPDVFLGYHHR